MDFHILDLFKKNGKIIFIVIFFSIIAIIYSGGAFFENINTAIPSGFKNGQVTFMTTGDHFTQFYKYSVVKNNILRGHSPYYYGYQFNVSKDSKEYTEGLMYFPFSFISAILGFAFGDILAFNLMILLSYIFTGLAMFYFVKYITKSDAISFVTSVLFITIPFRFGFLYGEMIFGIDWVLLPLLLVFFEKFIETNKFKYIGLFSLILFFFTGSNFVVLYFLILFGFPYFLFRFIQYIIDKNINFKEKFVKLIVLILSVIPSLINLAYFFSLISSSALKSGQYYDELKNYAPSVKDIFAPIGWNEKNIYLGFALLLVVLILFIFGLKRIKDLISKNEWFILLFFLPSFVISYFFCLGSNLDETIGINVFKWAFDHIPGFASSRTSGRIMVVSAFFFSVIFGVLLNYFINFISKKTILSNKRKIIIFTIYTLITLIIVINFKVTNPSMVTLDPKNTSYEKIQNSKEKVICLPLTESGGHHYNGTYVYYALKYNLNIFNGHSSMYPQKYTDLMPILYLLNEGIVTEKIYNYLKDNDLKYIVVHKTGFEPSVNDLTINLLKTSDFVNFINEDKGIFLFEVTKNNQILKEFNATKIVELINSGIIKKDDLTYLYGWYNEEKYEGQKSFRWMARNYSNIIYVSDKQKPNLLKFEYASPLTDLVIKINGVENIEKKITNIDGYHKSFELDLSQIKENYIFVEFSTEKIFKVDTDPREFGCQIFDLSIK